MTVLQIGLSKPQLNKLRKGANIRVSASSLARNEVSLEVSDSIAKRIQSCIRRGKGIQLNGTDVSEVVDGGSLKSIGKQFKKAGKSISRGFDVLEREAPGVIKQGGHELGRAAQQAKKYVPKDVLKAGVSAASLAVTAINPLAGAAMLRAGNAAVDATYDTNLARGSVGKNYARNFGKALVVNEVKTQLAGFSAAQKARNAAGATGGGFVQLGQSVRGGKLAKGSPEAAAFMANLRSKQKRNSAVGSGFGIQNHVRRLDGDSAHLKRNPNTIHLNLDSNGGDFMQRDAYLGKGFLPM